MSNYYSIMINSIESDSIESVSIYCINLSLAISEAKYYIDDNPTTFNTCKIYIDDGQHQIKEVYIDGRCYVKNVHTEYNLVLGIHKNKYGLFEIERFSRFKRSPEIENEIEEACMLEFRKEFDINEFMYMFVCGFSYSNLLGSDLFGSVKLPPEVFYQRFSDILTNFEVLIDCANRCGVKKFSIYDKYNKLKEEFDERYKSDNYQLVKRQRNKIEEEEKNNMLIK